ncbi:sulfotransferase family protein [Mangrovimonas cancribranchiae]|uniref:Sulfotransferase n=1 Tax=Mangrovimonas cancribranchiae TaxID=3080055 RepID=A0AAU6P202_9FLAO
MKNSPIFIIGVSRTGSKFYMQLLNSHKEIFIAPELMFKHPQKKDMFSTLNEELKQLDNRSLMDSIYNLNLKGSYKSTIDLVPSDLLIKHLNKDEVKNPYDVLNIILQLATQSEGKKIWGAKFPIHFSYTNELLKEINNCLVLFLTRDPRDIYTSDYTKKSKEKRTTGNKFPIKGYLLKPAVLFYTIWEWRRSLNVYGQLQKSKDHDRVRMFKYENIISQKENVVKDIANFIDESPEAFSTEEMKIVDSSFSKKLELNRWKKKLSLIEKLIFKIAVGRKMKKYGYY